MMHDPPEPGAPSTHRSGSRTRPASGTLILRFPVTGVSEDLQVQLINVCARITEGGLGARTLERQIEALFGMQGGPKVRVGRIRAAQEMTSVG